jgi:hypothetical protein
VGARAFVVAHHRSQIETRLTDTDVGMSTGGAGRRRR